MPIPDEVLALRPGNAVAALPKGSGVLLASVRDLVRADPDHALLTMPAFARQALPGLLQAAKSLDACLGISLGAELPAPAFTPASLVAALAQEADEVGLLRPLFLHAEGIAVADKERARRRAFAFVDAGFTSASFDPGPLSIAESAPAIRAAAEPFVERELWVEALLPEGADLAEAQAMAGALPGFTVTTRAAGASVRLTAALGKGKVSALGIDRLGRAERSAAAGSGVARVAPGPSVAERIARALPPELRDELLRHAAELGTSCDGAAGPFAGRIAELAPAWRDRLEALAYHEAADLLRQLGAVGGGRRPHALLAGGAGV